MLHHAPRVCRRGSCRARPTSRRRPRRNAAVLRGKAQSRCRRSRRHRRDRRRRRCPRRAPLSPPRRTDRSADRRALRARHPRPASPLSPCSSRRTRVCSSGRDDPPRPIPPAFFGGSRSGHSILPTATQMSRPDGVGELDRSHRHSERKRRLVDGLRRDAFVDAAHRRHQVRREHAVDEESWRALHRQRQLVDLPDECRGLGPRSTRVALPATTSTSIICATGLKKWMPTRRDGSRMRSRCPRAECSTYWSRESRRASLCLRAPRTGCAWRRGSRRSPR